MLQFKYTHLRLPLVPLIERQMQAITAYHTTLRAEIDEGRMEALEKLVELKAQVGQRARELQAFMKEYEEEVCIAYLRSQVERMLGRVFGEKEGRVREEEKFVPWKVQNRKKDLAVSSKSSCKSISPLKDSKMARSSKGLQESRAESKRLDSSHCSKSKIKSNSQQMKQMPRNPKIPPSHPTTGTQANHQQSLPHFAVAQQPASPLQISFNNKHLFSAEEQTMVTFKLSRKDYQQILRLKVRQKPMK